MKIGATYIFKQVGTSSIHLIDIKGLDLCGWDLWCESDERMGGCGEFQLHSWFIVREYSTFKVTFRDQVRKQTLGGVLNMLLGYSITQAVVNQCFCFP